MKYPHSKLFLGLSILMLNFSIKSANARNAIHSIVAPDTINVKQFGAKGDNIQNDSAAFQNAIKSASQQRKVLFVPKGIYKISNLVLYPDCNMVGVDSSSVLVLTDGSASNRQCISLTAISQHIRLKNLCFDANGRHNSGKNIFCVHTILDTKAIISDIIIQNCQFTDSKNYGALFLIGPTDHITHVVVFKCKFYNTGLAAVSVRGLYDFTFTNNTILDWDVLDKVGSGFALQSEPCSNITFTGNYFKNKDAVYFAIECAGTYVKNSKFTDNTFDGNGHDASGISGMFDNCLFRDNKHINGGGTHRSGYELVGDNDTLINNTIEKGCISLGTGSPGVTYAKGGSGYIITGNRVTANYGVNNLCLTIGGDDTVKSAFIANNIFDNRTGKGNSPVIQIGQRGPATNITIQNNELYGSPKNACIRMNVGTGIPFSGNIKIVKNKFVGENGAQIDNMKIWKNMEISDNDFKGITGSVFIKNSDFTPDFHINNNINYRKP
jgi:hypothetical protein